MTADVVIVIVTYNSADVVAGLLDSLPAGVGDLATEVVVVDNGSTDGTVALLNARDDCRVVQDTNRGYSAGINRGVEAAGDAPAVLILNADVRLTPGSVPPLLAALERPEVGIVAPRVVDGTGRLHPSLRREPSLLRVLGLTRTGVPALSEYVTAPAEYDRAHDVDWALGAALLVRRTCHDALGGWDESYFLYSEETDLSLRARDLGWVTTYVPGSTVVHLEGASGRSPRTYAMQAVNRVRLYRRRHGALASWCYLGLVTGREALRVVTGDRSAAPVVAALVRPSARPAELGCSDRLLPS